MSFLRARQDFSPSCPNGGSWYSCGYGSRFVGCCRSEACANNCPAGNLEAASFDPSFYGQFPDQNCGNGEWYSCNATVPPFLGCCTSNACNTASGCPSEDLGDGFLSNNPDSPTSSESASATKSNSVSVGAIVGGVVGGICVLAIAVGIFFYMRRRKRKGKPQELQESEFRPKLDAGKAGGASELAANQPPRKL
ncbi:hypothetical protein K490DRAFT_39912 [Saccharata proteae CBS 121410]|uniref:Mid2 domain-containing protein n=1 Tax=Saccharata proteae CBS 121410 TaxID=1314787 RepID=A0A9P4LXL6_9PEZI|nr:hypothetical protein K490DRAFT_39912 [Saccharata proteae CBS 121410]